MSEKKFDGGPAFPATLVEGRDGDVTSTVMNGMTLRDYFAGQAISGVLYLETNPTVVGETAKAAYEIADAMLKEREK